MLQNLGMGSRITDAVWSILLAFAFVTSAGSQDLRKSVELVDINRATVVELLKAPGMTASWAQRIVRFRPYRSKFDLVEQGVVTPEVYRRIRDGVIAHRVVTDDAEAHNKR
jgi:DNA uptake protein ComE-like DNA-binding protein